MWVRAVAAALAVWGVSGAAMAAGYTEVWNPPEASRHVAAKPANKKPAAIKPRAGAGLRTDARHAAHTPHQAARVAAAGQGGEKIAARGGVKKVAAKGSARQMSAGAGKVRPKAAGVAQGKKPHAQLVRAKAGQGKVVPADLARPARPHAVGVATKRAAVKPAASNHALPVASANFNGGAADVSTNPATASSGSLPPIIH